jgi:sugar phosphate isomerase/epimerase
MHNAYADKSEYAASSWIYAAVPLHDALRDIAGHGFTGVELWGDTIHFDPRAGLDHGSIKQWLRELGLSVHSVHSPFRNFSGFKDADAFRRYRQQLWRETIDDCAEFAVPIMVVHGINRKEYNYTGDQLDIVKDSLGDLCEYGSRRGVAIALENIPGSAGSRDEIPCNLRDHVRNFAGLGLRYCLDIGHAALNGTGIFEEIDAARTDLITFHIHNNDGLGDTHNLPTEGIIDWPRVHSYVRRQGYSGQFVLEVYGGTDPFSVMNRIDNLFRQGKSYA